ncbi:MAG TPA: glycosyltransferase [Flexivirga sp.]|uniref:glycosyltransferase n=1 Tax=Flexivirga sp. TaxID=1962927 RepID=UPI002C39F9B6|nr:glycosyltransferase [Flexivirga sp.]HWC23444.1 glycosyltransferase [Flexivirga sp.]
MPHVFLPHELTADPPVPPLMPRPVAVPAAHRVGREQHVAPRIAIAHDYLTQMGGAERVVLSLARAFPTAPIYTTLYDPGSTFPEFRQMDVRASPLDRVAPLRKHYRAALPLLPFAARSMRIDADIVIASSSGWAHGFSTDAKRLVYCHTPARWLYVTDDFLGDRPSPIAAGALRMLSPALRRWDRRAAGRADRYLANSAVAQGRVRDCYGIDATVLAPPYRVDVKGDRVQPEALRRRGWSDFHLVVSRLLPYKHVDQVLAAWRNLPSEHLVVVGTGPLADELRRQAPPNAVMLDGVPDAELRWLYANATALIGASHEDFGLTVIEAAAFGTPTLALRAGGYLESIVEGRTGYFFEESVAADIANAVLRHRDQPLSRLRVSDHAARFSEASFIEQIRAAVAELAASGCRPAARARSGA